MLNAARTQEYARALLPTLHFSGACASCSNCQNLPALLGDGSYASPLQDVAPWYDKDNPFTSDFAGLFPLAMDGFTDDTRTANVIQSVGDGGWVVGKRDKTREMRVKVAAFARSDEGMYAGKLWLKQVLDGACAEDCDDGSDLCFMTACPDPDDVTPPCVTETLARTDIELWEMTRHGASIVPDLNAASPHIRTRRLYAPLPCGAINWRVTLRGTAGHQTILRLIGDDQIIQQVGINLTGVSQVVEMSEGSLALKNVYLTISAPSEEHGAIISDAEEGAIFSDIEDWYAQITPQAGSAGATLTDPGGATITDYDGDPSVEASISDASTVYTDIELASIEMTYPGEVDYDTVADQYTRTIRRVTCVEGPTTVERKPLLRGGVVEVLEFLLVAEIPAIYGQKIEVVNGSLTNVATRIPVLDKCPEKPVFTYLDPACPPPPLPPTVRTIATGCADDVKYKTAYAVPIPASAVPLWNSVAPIITLRAPTRTAATNLRVRFFAMPLDDSRPDEILPCAECHSFFISYIPPDHRIQIDSPSKRVWTITPEGVKTKTPHLVSGEGGGPFEWPTFSCGAKFFMVLDLSSSIKSLALSVVSVE